MEPGQRLGHVLRCRRLDTEVVESLTGARALEQHQLQRRVLDHEVGVAVALLVRGHPEQPLVERRRFGDVLDVERELNACGRHVVSLLVGPVHP